MRGNVCFHSLLPRRLPASLQAERARHEVTGAGAGAPRGMRGRGARVWLETALFINSGAAGQKDKEGRSEFPPPPAPAPATLISLSARPARRGGRCGGGSLLSRSSFAKGPAADVGAPAPVNEQQRQPGDCLATRLQTSSPPVGRGGVSEQQLRLKGKLSKFKAAGETRSWEHMRPKARCARAHRLAHWNTRARTHTLKHTRTLPLMFSIGVWVQSCVLREAELKRTGLPWRLGRSARLSWRLPRWTEGKEEYHPPLRVVSPVSEKISAKRGLPDAFGICLLSGAEKSVLGVVVNLGHLGSPATCFAQFSMEPWTHRAPGPSAFSPPFLLLSF